LPAPDPIWISRFIMTGTPTDSADFGIAGRASNRANAASALAETRTIRAIFSIGWLACLGVSAAVCRGLYADGAYAVLGLLQTPRYIDYDAHRSFASYITQTPILLGERFGVQKVPAYAALYTAGDYLPPALLFLAALALARRVPLLFGATCAAIVVFGFGSNYVNTEANLLYAGAWLAAVILALPGTRPTLRGFVLPAIAFVLLRVYEGMLIVGPVLALWAFVSSRSTGDRHETVGLTLATLLLVFAAFIGFSSLVAPRDPNNAASFATSALAYLENPQVFVLLGAACSLVAMTRPTAGPRRAWLAATAILLAAFVWRMVRLGGYYAYSVYYYNRSFLVLLLAAACVVLLLIQRNRPAWLSKPFGAPALLAAVLPFVVVAGVDILGRWRW
jgi:hypothetical protein